MNTRSTVAVFFLFVLAAADATAQTVPYTFRGKSDLPLLVINTHQAGIPNDPKVDAELSIIDGGPGAQNALTETASLTSRIRIEVRGASSQMFDKKSYGFETVNAAGKDQDVALLGFPAESDWILYGPHSDKSLMRNHLAYALSNRIGRYAPRTRFVELFIRDSDKAAEEQYVGVYLLVEKIKRGSERVAVRKLKKRGAQGMSGGYIVKIDRVDGPETYFTTDLGTVLGHVSPRGGRLDQERRAWIQQDFSRFERVLAGAEFRNPEHGYARHTDTGSFIDFFLLNELFKNVDAYFLSTFLHRTSDGKIHMGPIWDFNLSSRNASYGGVWNTEGWMLFSKHPRQAASLPFWWDRLFEDTRFRKQLLLRWRELRRGPFSEASILGRIDATAVKLQKAQQRNFGRWRILGNYIWPNPRPYAMTYEQELNQLKSWFSSRIRWIDANIEALENDPADALSQRD